MIDLTNNLIMTGTIVASILYLCCLVMGLKMDRPLFSNEEIRLFKKKEKINWNKGLTKLIVARSFATCFIVPAFLLWILFGMCEGIAEGFTMLFGDVK